MAADGLKALFVKGGWSNSLFDIQPGECLQQCICFPCCTSPALNEKAGMVVPNKPAAIIVPFLGCGSCLIFMYGKKISVANSMLPKADLVDSCLALGILSLNLELAQDRCVGFGV